MRLRLVLRILWGPCCLLLLCMAVVDCIQFAKHPELYPIGSEGLDWVYESSENYALGCGMDIGWCIIGIAASASYRFRHSGKILLGHFVLTVLLVGWNLYICFQMNI